MGKIMETNNYSKFVCHEYNRDVERTRILEQSMKSVGFLESKPITVVRNGCGKFDIIDGHRRFDVARSLGLFIKYVEEKKEKVPSMRLIDGSTQKWTLKNYLQSYVRQNKEAYIKLMEYHNRTQIPLQACISMFCGQTAGSSVFDDKFRDGVFRIKDIEHAETVAGIVSTLRECEVLFPPTTVLTRAISRMIRAKGFDPQRMAQKIRRHFPFIKKQGNLEQYMTMLEDIYNRGSHEKIPLKFNADQAMKERNITSLKKRKAAAHG